MIDIKKAIEKANKAVKGCVVSSAVDVGDRWVFGFKGTNGEEVDFSPISVTKENGEIEEYFPPHHIEELENGIEVEI